MTSLWVEHEVLQKYSEIGGWAFWTGTHWSKDEELYYKRIEGE